MPVFTPSTTETLNAEPAKPQLGWQVRIMPAGWSFSAQADESLLAAAERAGIELPSSCRNGSCRSCLCTLESGQASHHIEWPGLSAEEKREGYILPCVAQAHSDLVVNQPWACQIGHSP